MATDRQKLVVPWYLHNKKGRPVRITYFKIIFCYKLVACGYHEEITVLSTLPLIYQG